MKHLTIFLATVVLTCLAFMPATARADDLDDLAVTMEVLDDVAELEDAISRMDGPDEDDFEDIDDDDLDEAREDG